MSIPLEGGQVVKVKSFDKLAGSPTDISKDYNINLICKQVIVNKHFRQLGVKAYNQQKVLLKKLSEITDRINQEQQDTQKEYKDNFYDIHNGWLS